MGRKRSNAVTPWGRLAGLLTGSAVTLAGVATQLDPHVILMRAATGAVLVGGTVAMGASVIRVTSGRGRLKRH